MRIFVWHNTTEKTNHTLEDHSGKKQEAWAEEYVKEYKWRAAAVFIGYYNYSPKTHVHAIDEDGNVDIRTIFKSNEPKRLIREAAKQAERDAIETMDIHELKEYLKGKV